MCEICPDRIVKNKTFVMVNVFMYLLYVNNLKIVGWFNDALNDYVVAHFKTICFHETSCNTLKKVSVNKIVYPIIHKGLSIVALDLQAIYM